MLLPFCGRLARERKRFGVTNVNARPLVPGQANFRLLNRLLTQMGRIIEINTLQQVTKAVVESARESLVIGET